MAIPIGNRTGNHGTPADLGVGILFAEKPMWGSTQSFGDARLKSMFLLDDLDVNLNGFV